MAKAKEKVIKLKTEDGIVYLKAIRPLTQEEHENLSAKLRFEAEKSGVNIVLIPFLAKIGE